MNIPEDCRYSSDHEWIRSDGQGGGRFRIGITDYAQDALGDVVFVELPEIGLVVKVNESICEVESTKSVSDIYAPMSGTVVEANSDLTDAPDRLNSDPYGEGWICTIDVVTSSDVDALLDAAAYQELTEG